MIAGALGIALFWLLLALPGYVLLRRCARPWLEAGPLAGLALGSFASFVLLTPVSVAAYALRWPLWVMSAAVVVLVIAAAVYLARTVRWALPRPRPSLVALVAGTLVLLDAFMGLRTGSYLVGDGIYHTGRVRMLLDHGFNSLDPMIEGRFDPIYHTNIYHALIAAAAQLTGLHAPHAWAFTQFWSKLAVAGSLSYLAWAVLRERSLAWIAAALFAVYMAASTQTAYPNRIAIYALVPLAIAFAVQASIGEHRRHAVAGLGATALVTAQVHGLYYVYVCMLVGPALLATLVWRRARRLDGARELAAALLALSLGLPWLATTAAHRGDVHVSPDDRAARVDESEPVDESEASAPGETTTAAPQPIAYHPGRDEGFVRLSNGQLMLDPSRLWSPLSPDLQLLLALGLIGLTRRRRAVLALLGPVLVLLVSLYVPPVCTRLAEIAREPWVVLRLSVAFHALWFALFFGALVLFARERLPAARWVTPLALALAIAYGYTQGVDTRPFTRARYLAAARDPAPLRGQLRRHASRRELFDRTIPRGATVLTGLSESPRLTTDCTCYPLAITQGRGNRGLVDMQARRLATNLLLRTDNLFDLPARLALLRRYNVTAMWLQGGRGRKLARIYSPLVARETRSGRHRVLVLDLSRTP